MKSAILFFLVVAPVAVGANYFEPSNRIAGIGVSRDDLSSDMIEVRTDHMVQSQTFTIMREPQALPGARRITGSDRLQLLFRKASESTGLPASLIEAISYLESWGDAKAESPSGPKGIMQISQATATFMGLKVVWATRYKTTREKVPVKSKNARGKTVYRTVTRKTPYKVMVRDDRLIPERAIPAAGRYLAWLEQKFGGRDWAIFAYHCGPGCVSMMQDLTRKARGIPKDEITVPRMFFSCSPAWNRELYEAIQQQMQRDYSPTYWFRVTRAEQLLALYRRDPVEFAELAQEYKSQFTGANRAPHRLAVWLKREDMVYHNQDDIRADPDKKLTKALDRPDYFGYQLDIAANSPDDLEYFREAAPAAIGTLTYLAFETRRLWEETGHKGETFKPLDVTSLVEPDEASKLKGRPEVLSHASGQVFDIDYSALPPAEIECLRFVLDDLGWDGFLGFVEEGRDNLHIGCSPASREFFTTVYKEAVGQA